MPDNFLYNRNLRKYASSNRKESTKAEVKLWTNVLRTKNTGYQFLRQRPIGNYILDFYCKELKLAIEVDGATHHNEIQNDYDMQKDAFLKGLGVRVLRLKDEDVMNNISGVSDWIRLNIEEIVKIR